MQTYHLNGLPIGAKHAFQKVLDNIDLGKGMIAYAKEALASNDLEPWERKSYQQVMEDTEKELSEAELHLQNLLEMFPEVLVG